MEVDQLPAGPFSAWLSRMLDALDGTVDADVACGTCTACCASSQFVHVGPDETDALAHLPSELLFPAPGLPAGHVVLGYDDRGRCPMLTDAGCSIYEHRPRTCRTYDCRVFPAAGLDPAEDGKSLIAERSRRWVFDHPTDRDGAEHWAVRAAATYVRAHPDVLPPGAPEPTATQLAVLAVELHETFVGNDEPNPDEVRVAITGRRR